MAANVKEKSSTGLAVASILTIAGAALTAMFDGDANTNVAWPETIGGLVSAVSLLFASFKKS